MLTTNKVSQMKELITKIKEADTAYFVHDNPIITDKEYDSLVDRLQSLEKETGIVFSGSPTKKVSGGVKKELKSVVHTKPMLSAKKTKSVKEIGEFIGGKSVVMSWKLDGLTIVLRYKGGLLYQAITRGQDGTVGEDVTHAVKHFRNLPKRIKCKEDIEVRGEGVLSWNDYKIITKEDSDNHPRHIAASLTRSVGETNIGRLNHVDFFAFDIVSNNVIESKYEQFKYMESIGLPVVPYYKCSVNHDKTIDKVVDDLKPEEFSYPVDGLIFEYDDIAYGRSLGSTGHHENRLIALKWEDKEYETTFTGVQLTTTRTGLVSIIAKFEDVNINGVVVRKAKIASLSKFKEFQFGVGDKIKVYSANMIIPQVAENVTKSGTYQVSKYCPCCGENLEIRTSKNGIEDLYCPNETCIARNAQKLARFCDSDAMGIEGMSATFLETLMGYGWINNYVDLYHIDRYKKEIVNTIGLGSATYNRIRNAIENSRNTTLGKFIVGMGIVGVGPEAGLALDEYFEGSFDKFEKAIEDEFCFSHISGVTAVAERNIYKWYNDKTEEKLWRPLLKELRFGTEECEEKSYFADKKVAYTGALGAMSPNDVRTMLVLLGANVCETVMVETDILIVGNEPSGRQIARALEYKVKVIYEQEFLELLNM